MWSIAHHLSAAGVFARATPIAQHTVHLSTASRRSVFSGVRFAVSSPVKAMLPGGVQHQVRQRSERATVSPDIATLQTALDHARKAAGESLKVVASLERMRQCATESGTNPDALPPDETMRSISPAMCSQQTAANGSLTEPEMFTCIANEFLKNGVNSCLDRLPAETLRKYLRTLMGNGVNMPPEIVLDIATRPWVQANFLNEFVTLQGGMKTSYVGSQHELTPDDLAAAIATSASPVRARFMEYMFIRTWLLPSITYLNLPAEKKLAYRPHTVAECCETYNEFSEWNMMTEESDDEDDSDSD
ncbi:hypothetical protein FN846DRAFT_903402 [Sphaerosporella brunnea]|uniref:Uncharacterized protein n=1 Tax=Sphaerosporella brunnea TaxID=1250544 RepID=A0A5J5F7C5_9PEZI|nr:hypothetical protein FN846DRAFT_903402 [Sphaerosporella brunnea]